MADTQAFPFTAWSFTDLPAGASAIFSNYTFAGTVLEIHPYPVRHHDAAVAANRLTLKNYINGLGIN